MTLSTRIAPHLPFLRRFSRAVSGSQASGDALVAALLEAIIADISIFPKASSDRIALYKIFAKLFTSIVINVPSERAQTAWEQHAAANLSALAPRPRQAFLLIAVEGFSEEEAAEVLDVAPDEFASLLRQASNEISRQVATDILIIEDEPLIAMDIEEMVTSLGHRVVGTARTHKEATALFTKARPKMVLADIQLADGPGHQAVQPRHGEGFDQPGAVLRPPGEGGRLTKGTGNRQIAFKLGQSKETGDVVLDACFSCRGDYRGRVGIQRHRRRFGRHRADPVLHFPGLPGDFAAGRAPAPRRLAKSGEPLKADPLKRLSASAGLRSSESSVRRNLLIMQ
jgi:DNA-directed RNA polymerase specialized sigma24 family protein